MMGPEDTHFAYSCCCSFGLDANSFELVFAVKILATGTNAGGGSERAAVGSGGGGGGGSESAKEKSMRFLAELKSS